MQKIASRLVLEGKVGSDNITIRYPPSVTIVLLAEASGSAVDSLKILSFALNYGSTVPG
jgi:hypothetical protein